MKVPHAECCSLEEDDGHEASLSKPNRWRSLQELQPTPELLWRPFPHLQHPRPKKSAPGGWEKWPKNGSNPPARDALEGEGPQRRPQKPLDRRSEEVSKAVGGGYCQLEMSLRLALGVRETVAGHRLGALAGGRYLPPFQCIPHPRPPL